MPTFFGKEVWQDDRPYREQSPLFRMKNVKTPVLIENGEADQRVPVLQAWELYNTLIRQGTEVKMIIYPGTRCSQRPANHDADRPCES